MSTQVSYQDITLILPTLNEADNIESMIRKLKELYPDIHILVADDGSQDGTGKIVTSLQSLGNVQLLDRSKAAEHGITASVVDALTQIKTPFFINMDADFQHPPEAIQHYLEPFTKGTPLVVGTRKPYHDEQPIHRYLISRSATFAAFAICKLRKIKVSDPMSGFFGGKTDIIRDVTQKNIHRLEPKGYKILFDILRVMDKDIEVEQIFYHFAQRAGGDSKFGLKHGFYFLRSLFE